ncbi:MAG: DNA polymerase III subunit delta [Clostridia bacterium]
MDYQALNDRLKKDIIDNVYLLFGENSFFIEDFALQLRKALFVNYNNEIEVYNLTSESSLDEILAECLAGSLFAHRKLLIVKNSKLFTAKSEAVGEAYTKQQSDDLQKLESYLKAYNENVYLLFLVEGKVDKRKKLFCCLKNYNYVHEIVKLKNYEIAKWAENYIHFRGSKIRYEALEYLIGTLEYDCYQIGHTIEKLLLYSNLTTIDLQTTQKLISTSNYGDIFAFLDAWKKGNDKLVLLNFNQLLLNRESVTKLVIMLYKRIRQLLQISLLLQDGFSSKQLTEKLDLKPFLIQKYIKQAKAFEVFELKNQLINLLFYIENVRTGKVSEEKNFELFILKSL